MVADAKVPHMPNGQAALEDGKANGNLPMPVEEAAPPLPVVPVTTVPTWVAEPTAESVDVVALVTVVDGELDAAKSEDTAPQISPVEGYRTFSRGGLPLQQGRRGLLLQRGGEV